MGIWHISLVKIRIETAFDFYLFRRVTAASVGGFNLDKAGLNAEFKTSTLGISQHSPNFRCILTRAFYYRVKSVSIWVSLFHFSQLFEKFSDFIPFYIYFRDVCITEVIITNNVDTLTNFRFDFGFFSFLCYGLSV